MTTLQRPLAAAAALTGGVLSAFAVAAGAGNSAAHITESPYVSSLPASSVPIVRINPSFSSRVNHVCARTNAAIYAAHGPFPFPNFDPLHPDPTTLPKVGAFFARSQPISDRVPAKLEKLGNPRTGRTAWNRLLRLAKHFQHIADRQIKAAQAADIPAFVATVRQQQATDTRIKHLALKAGFQKSSPCGTYY